MPEPEPLNHSKRQEPNRSLPPLPSFALAERCPACNATVHRQHCKVRCTRCGFFWDCSEL